MKKCYRVSVNDTFFGQQQGFSLGFIISLVSKLVAVTASGLNSVAS